MGSTITLTAGIAGWTMAIVVVAGVQNVLPPRWDRRFRRWGRTYEASSSGLSDDVFSLTKVDTLVGRLAAGAPSVAVLAFDVDAARTHGHVAAARLVAADDSPPANRAIAVAPVGACDIRVRRATVNLGLLAIGHQPAYTRATATRLEEQVVRLCGGVCAGRTAAQLPRSAAQIRLTVASACELARPAASPRDSTRSDRDDSR